MQVRIDRIMVAQLLGDPFRVGTTHPKPGSLLKRLATLQQRSGSGSGLS
jgi:hypothetical protein